MMKEEKPNIIYKMNLFNLKNHYIERSGYTLHFHLNEHNLFGKRRGVSPLFQWSLAIVHKRLTGKVLRIWMEGIQRKLKNVCKIVTQVNQ